MRRIFGSDLENEFKRNEMRRVLGPINSRIVLEDEQTWSHINLEWEYGIGHDRDGNKERMHYGEHLLKMQKSDWERAPTPQEAYSLLLAKDEGRLSKEGDMYKVATSIELGRGEYSCHAMAITDNSLFIYEDVHRMSWDDVTDRIGSIEYNGKVEFEITGLKRGGWNWINAVNDINPDLIEYLYTRKYEDLPTGPKNNGEIYVTNLDGTHMISFTINDPLDLYMGSERMTSRGVKRV